MVVTCKSYILHIYHRYPHFCWSFRSLNFEGIAKRLISQDFPITTTHSLRIAQVSFVDGTLPLEHPTFHNAFRLSWVGVTDPVMNRTETVESCLPARGILVFIHVVVVIVMEDAGRVWLQGLWQLGYFCRYEWFFVFYEFGHVLIVGRLVFLPDGW